MKIKIWIWAVGIALVVTIPLILKAGNNKATNVEEGLDITASDSIVKEIVPKKVVTPLPPESEKLGYPQDYFRNPIDGEIRVSGTFGELRSNHFHAGLDIRTGGVQGKNIYAVADGYVSRINVSTYGYGKAIYIRHPNGYTSVYGHLKGYKGEIAKYVENQQYKRKSFAVQLYPAKDFLKVKKGDIIALSGNTGGSGGPHLHFEIRSTATEATINPMLFGLKVKDNIKPRIQRLYVHEIDSLTKRSLGYYKSKKLPTPKELRGKTISLKSGKYGLGVLARDYFLSYSERLGINYMTLTVNDEEIFDISIEKFKFSESRYMNCHMDFSGYKLNSVKETKLWKDNGNKLKFYNHKNSGIIELFNDSSIRVKLVIKDASGLKDELEFYLRGDDSQMALSKEESRSDRLFSPFKTNTVTKEDIVVTVPKGSLYDHYYFTTNSYESKYRRQSAIHRIGRYHVPMHKPMIVKLRTINLPEKLQSKIYVIEDFRGGKYPVACGYWNGFAKFTTKDFGTYYVALDTIKPLIKPISLKPHGIYRFYISDRGGSGIKSFSATIDGKWFLLNYEHKNGSLKGSPRERLTKGKHKLVLKVTDETDNTATFARTINIL